MKLLLDSHTLLWWLEGSPSLGDGARDALSDAGNVVWYSMATMWELGIKIGLGKLSLSSSLREVAEQLESTAIRPLPIRVEHCDAVATLAFHHRDPFDRLLVAQALTEGMVLVSKDPALDAYGIERMW